MGHDVFISHAAKDKAIADAVCATLEAEKIRCWIAPRDIRSGEHWAEAINNAIKKTRVMVLIFSASSNQSKQVARELTLAVNSEAIVIPFKIDDILPSGVIEYYLTDTHWLDAMNPPTERQLQGLVQTVGSYIGSKQVSPAETENIDLNNAAIDVQESNLVISDQAERKTEESKFAPKRLGYPYKRAGLLAAVILGCGLLIFAGIKQFQSMTETDLASPPDTEDASILVQTEADYYIDYENGTIPIGDLAIGARVADPSWEWEFRTGSNYKREIGDETKPVTWIVVASDHYSGLDPHVTLLSEELIGNLSFDNSTDRANESGSNHWGESGTTNASHGVRPWLNSSGIHKGKGFYQAFSDNFKSAVLSTALPNKYWDTGNTYTTSDKVFLPSTTELGDAAHRSAHRIGYTYNYFIGKGNEDRIGLINGNVWHYWTRSPGPRQWDFFVRIVYNTGEFYSHNASNESFGVRPALNLKSETLVSENRD